MKFELYIATGNAAFEGDGKAVEVARILNVAALKLCSGYQGSLSDFNGNRVGEFTDSSFSKPPLAGAFVMSFDMNTAAFEDNGTLNEATSIISQAASKCLKGEFEFSLRDSNGNRIGGAYEVPEQADEISALETSLDWTPNASPRKVQVRNGPGGP